MLDVCVVEAPHTPQNFAPGFKGELHFGQLLLTNATGVPQNAQNFVPGVSG